MNPSSPEIKMNRQQIAKLIEMYNHFPEVQQFAISVDRSSGIGAGVSVSFDLFECSDLPAAEIKR